MSEPTEAELAAMFATAQDEPVPEPATETETEPSETAPAEEAPVEPEPEPVEPEDPMLKTKMGRKLKRLESLVQENMATKADIQELKELLRGPGNKLKYEPEDEEEVVISTSKDLDAYLERKKQREIDKQQRESELSRKQYGSTYMTMWKNVKDDPDYKDIVADLEALMTDEDDLTYNTVYSNYSNAASDFNKNFAKALRRVYADKEAAKPKNPFEGKKPASATGAASTTAPATAKGKPLELEADTKLYMQSMGISEEEMKSLLGT
jgi:hypothetical protein